jgi:glycosyl-4,4'-diaponeurosporenoate acyltransferase
MTYPAWFYILANASIWVIWSILVGYAANFFNDKYFEKDTLITRLRKFETQIWFQKYLKVHIAKRYLPEKGVLFGKGTSKKSLPIEDPAALKRLLIETRRAEYVHWIVIFAWVFTLWFNPPWAAWTVAILLVFGNLPCILVQRYNRLRLLRILKN